MSVWPCRQAPDRWFATDRVSLGQAVHGCLRHCPRLDECAATEQRPIEGVLAGMLYNTHSQPHGKQPQEVSCGGCVAHAPNKFTRPRPEIRPGCGTWGAIRRHRKAGERLCMVCAVFDANHRRRVA